MKISARNVFKGKVKEVKHGVVNSEVIVGLPGGAEIVSVITKESARAPAVDQGQRGLRGYQGL